MISLIALVAAAVLGVPAPGSSESFAAPLSGWANLRRDYHARGNGRADDTAALQRALTDLRSRRRGSVLFVPAGVYRVTAPLGSGSREPLPSGAGIQIVGEDPATTTIRWDGPVNAPLLRFTYPESSLRRITLDGGGRAAAALALGVSAGFATEIADCYFRDASVGIQVEPQETASPAPVAIVRCRFLRCEVAGALTGDAACGPAWFWQCRFEDCAAGIRTPGSPLTVGQCLFLHSGEADIAVNGPGLASAVGCTSIGSARFIDSSSAGRAALPVSVFGCTVIDPAPGAPIRPGAGGAALIVDATVRSRLPRRGPEVASSGAEVCIVGWASNGAVTADLAPRTRVIGSATLEPGTQSAAAPSLPDPLPVRPRRLFEPPRGADASAIQRAIDAAVASGARRALIHLSPGVYPIARTLRIPAGTDLQLAGDSAGGTGTVLRWTGESAGPVLLVEGPGRASVRDLRIEANGAEGILATSCDSPAGRILLDQVMTDGAGSQGADGIVVDGLEQSAITARGLQGGAGLERWLVVRDRPGRGSSASAARLSVTSGVFVGPGRPYVIERAGRLLVRSVAHTITRLDRPAISLSGEASLSLDSCSFAYTTPTDAPVLRTDSLNGELLVSASAIMAPGSAPPARVVLAGSGEGSGILALACRLQSPEHGVRFEDLWRDTTLPPAAAGLALSSQLVAPPEGGRPTAEPWAALADRGETGDAFILRMLRPMRTARAWPDPSTPAGAVDLHFHRVVIITRGRPCFRITSAPAAER